MFRIARTPAAAGSSLLRLTALFAASILVCCLGLATQARAATPGLLAGYAFSETGGATTADQSGRQHTGTLTNVLRTTSGRYGRALSFDGTSSILRVADAADLDLTKGMTIEAWVRPSGSVAGSRTIASKTRAGGGFPYGLELNAGRPGA